MWVCSFHQRTTCRELVLSVHGVGRYAGNTSEPSPGLAWALLLFLSAPYTTILSLPSWTPKLSPSVFRARSSFPYSDPPLTSSHRQLLALTLGSFPGGGTVVAAGFLGS